MKFRKNLILLLPLLKDGVGDEQMKFEVSGVVTDGYRTPLPGVTVLAKSGKVVLGTATSTDGKYRLTIPSTLKRFSISFLLWVWKPRSWNTRERIRLMLF